MAFLSLRLQKRMLYLLFIVCFCLINQSCANTKVGEDLAGNFDSSKDSLVESLSSKKESLESNKISDISPQKGLRGQKYYTEKKEKEIAVIDVKTQVLDHKYRIIIKFLTEQRLL